jgi:tetratricopeptide (TPR) repeat protein/transcriptional regulator with XRE-family HTH domain
VLSAVDRAVTDYGVTNAMSVDATRGLAANRQRMAQRRKALGLTQEDLAELLAVERSTVVRWERGLSEPLPWIRPKLAKALRVSTDRLETLLAVEGQEAQDGPGQVPQQLPAVVADFTGRAAEVQSLTQMLDQAGPATPGTVVISAIGGMAGVGKTALALHWAHLASHRFPDGQLYVNLRGFGPSGSPTPPEEVIRGFLDALAIPPERVPRSPEAQAGLYRSLLAQRRMLIVVDNARDEQQVRPLLPASPGTLVLVTSRSQLTGLAAEGARLLSLEVLAEDEARQLLSARIGQARADAEPGAVAELARLCECLPLALAVVAARAAARPRLPLAALADELRDISARLDALESGDPAGSVRAVFSWSYEQLSPDAARLFRLLSLHPGHDISAPVAASLAATQLSRTRQHLGELARAHLIAEEPPGRYTLHDLLRAYATELADTIDPQDAARAAVGRALDHYLHTAHTAALLYKPSRDPISLTMPRPGVVPEILADHRQALSWFEAEHQALLSAIGLADRAGFDVHAWQIPWTVGSYLDWRGHWHEWLTVQGIAVAAVTRLGDATGQVMSRRMLASAFIRVGQYDEALDHLGQCLQLSQQLGERSGEAQVLKLLAVVAEAQGRYAAALDHCEQALGMFQTLGDRSNEAQMLNNIGWMQAQLGDYQKAREFCQRSITLHAQLGHRNPEAIAWDSLGYVEHHLGNLAEAMTCYERALGLTREFGYRLSEARILTHLGDTRQASGDVRQARDAWRQALDVLDDLDHPLSDQVREKLTSTADLAASKLS